jgi:diguanylate cyclase (GGDEF)-like protein
MKIRTKLLMALGAISLFTPIAAYVALIGNPRISFALRMNDSQTQQGLKAQKLSADLNAVDSAVHESLADSYRARVEPAEREAAERQRKLANSVLLSAIAKYETDLHTVAQSQAEQVREIRAVRNATEFDAVEQRETQLLQQLTQSAPNFKSSVEKFLQLSDGTSNTEGDFVYNVLQPEIRGDLSKTVQELASGTNQAAEGYRRSIDKALADSYKETLVIVLLGLTVGIVLATIISRGVVAPIQSLRNAALQFGQGKLDTRIVRYSKDELGELAGSFNSMADNLTALMAERKQVQEELSSANLRLKSSMGELESRNRAAGALSEMADLLQSCFTLQEASRVITSSAQRLFPEVSGMLMVFSASRNILEAVATWGPNPSKERVFGPNDCWALRRGRLHHSSSDEGSVRCAHLGAESLLIGLCTPLMAHGETLGILCLVRDANEAARRPDGTPAFNVQLAVSVAEQAGLSFANLKLREKLRYQSIRDPLTGLFNRRYLDESLERELPRAVRTHRGLGIIMVDVDKFKRFNDMFGHDAGDTVLRELGDYLAKFIRRGDLACRYGGEEFTLVLPEASLEDTRRRAEELRIAFQQMSIKHRDVVLGKVTLSLGVAAFPEHGSTPEDLMAAADGALLRAKEEGRNRVLVAQLSTNAADQPTQPARDG